jgi:hypothetical protein
MNILGTRRVRTEMKARIFERQSPRHQAASMTVQCTHKPGMVLTKAILDLGNSPNAVFNVTFGREYTVYAMCIWKYVLHYLILNDETQRPDWFPFELFQLDDARLPSNWCFGFIGGQPEWPIEPVWGYPEITLDSGTHYLALMERDASALDIFARRRLEIDNEFQAQIL